MKPAPAVVDRVHRDRAPCTGDRVQLPEGPCWVAGYVLGEAPGFLLRPVGQVEASDADTFLSAAAWRDELKYSLLYSEWRERPTD